MSDETEDGAVEVPSEEQTERTDEAPLNKGVSKEVVTEGNEDEDTKDGSDEQPQSDPLSGESAKPDAEDAVLEQEPTEVDGDSADISDEKEEVTVGSVEESNESAEDGVAGANDETVPDEVEDLVESVMNTAEEEEEEEEMKGEEPDLMDSVDIRGSGGGDSAGDEADEEDEDSLLPGGITDSGVSVLAEYVRRCSVRAEIYNFEIEDEVVYYFVQINIDGFEDRPTCLSESIRSTAKEELEYTLKKRYSEFSAFHKALCRRFHLKRLPALPGKTLQKKLDIDFIAERKTFLNKYLCAVTDRLYLFHSDLVWRFLEISDRVNSRRHRYRPVHLGSLQCNDFPLISETEDTSILPSPLAEQTSLPAPPDPAEDDGEDDERVTGVTPSNSSADQPFKSVSSIPDPPSSPPPTKPPSSSSSVTDSSTEKGSAGFWSSLISRFRSATSSPTDGSMRADRQWKVLYVQSVNPDTIVTVSQIYTDLKRKWFGSLKKEDSPPLIDTSGGSTTEQMSDQTLVDPERRISMDVISSDGRPDYFKGKIEVFRWSPLSEDCLSPSSPESATDADLTTPRTMSSPVSVPSTPVFHRSPMGGTYLSSTSGIDGEFSSWVSNESHSRFLMRANRPSCALFVPIYKLLYVGTSLGGILVFLFDDENSEFVLKGTLPVLFAQKVTGLLFLSRSEVKYDAGAYADASKNNMPKGVEALQKLARGYLYAISEDCSIGVYDLWTSDALGVIRTAASPNLSICSHWNRLFVGCREKYIVCLKTSKHMGRPVPEKELFGHSKAVTCMLPDPVNDRLFSGGNDNAICVWLYNERMKDYMHVQHLKSVCKSSGFTSLALLNNRQCLAAGSNDGSITIWHERVFVKPRLTSWSIETGAMTTPGSARSSTAAVGAGAVGSSKSGSGTSMSPGSSSALAASSSSSSSSSSTMAEEGVSLASKSAGSTTARVSGVSASMKISRQVSKNSAVNGAESSRKSRKNKVWKCLCTWRAHSSAVTSLYYIEEWSLLVSSGNDGVVRVVYVPHPDSFPVINRDFDLDSTVNVKEFPSLLKERMKAVYHQFDSLDESRPWPKVL